MGEHDPVFAWVDFEAPLWVSFSSGATGALKGFVHEHGGFLPDSYKLSGLYFALRHGDRFLRCTTTDWMVWNLFVSGLLIGATSMPYDGSPAFPDPKRLFEVASEQAVAVLGVVHGYLRTCAKAGVEPDRVFDLGDLRVLDFTGAPLSARYRVWVRDHVGVSVHVVSVTGGADVVSGFAGSAPATPVWAGGDLAATRRRPAGPGFGRTPRRRRAFRRFPVQQWMLNASIARVAVCRLVEGMIMARAHLNGSVSLSSASEVFSVVAEILGKQVHRVPDGETSRPEWVRNLGSALLNVDGVENRGTRFIPEVQQEYPVLSIADGVAADDLDFSPVDFASIAIQSHSAFLSMRERMASDTRFMVALPTPTAVMGVFFQLDQLESLVPAFTRHLAHEITAMTRIIPPQNLALQWDVAIEPALIFRSLAGMPTFPAEMVHTQLAELASLVPTNIELGYHLCYGDPRPDTDIASRGRHFTLPEDLEMLVAMANDICMQAGRNVNWFSMPVPVGQGTDTYFAPLADLRVGSATEIYLGVVHDEDGLAGSQRRVDTAKRHLTGFGVSTDCGMGRIEPEAIRPLLEIHRDLVV
ncbi:AMP-binding protein [Amycolatopsis jiangsuensis]|uniref:AMP-dependent synthetase/ligase domain-containing protein n=1 Tax=Amycolatopsis jiangsuensis TaxID=1181879 RepID=A0A840IQ51_9PSEU|nr:AMP-binding protein [Amycolatopsis jiangsuensis]MBB4683322.1 hypothetical protein [Amycolatopsis jiangsuensis]